MKEVLKCDFSCLHFYTAANIRSHVALDSFTPDKNSVRKQLHQEKHKSLLAESQLFISRHFNEKTVLLLLLLFSEAATFITLLTLS